MTFFFHDEVGALLFAQIDYDFHRKACIAIVVVCDICFRFIFQIGNFENYAREICLIYLFTKILIALLIRSLSLVFT